MPRFAANLSTMYTDMPFLERFAAAAADGFRGVEYLFPYDYSAERIAALLRELDLIQVMFNLYPGDFSAGERGLAALPGREEAGYFHMPGGQSGHPLSPWYRAGHDAWVRGEPTSFLPGPAEHALMLLPAG